MVVLYATISGRDHAQGIRSSRSLSRGLLASRTGAAYSRFRNGQGQSGLAEPAEMWDWFCGYWMEAGCGSGVPRGAVGEAEPVRVDNQALHQALTWRKDISSTPRHSASSAMAGSRRTSNSLSRSSTYVAFAWSVSSG